MTDELIDQIKRDRDAGTPGPWVADTIDADAGDFEVYSGSEETPYLIARIIIIPSGEHKINLPRIARVPEMEARILSDADEIIRLKKLLVEARQWNWIDFEDANPEDNEAFTPALCDLNRKINEALK